MTPEIISGLVGVLIGGTIGLYGSVLQWRLAETARQRAEFDHQMAGVIDICYDAISFARDYWLLSHVVEVHELRKTVAGRSPMYRLFSTAMHTAPELRDHFVRAGRALERLDSAPLPIGDALYLEVASTLTDLAGVVSRYRNSRPAKMFTPRWFGAAALSSAIPFEPEHKVSQ